MRGGVEVLRTMVAATQKAWVGLGYLALGFALGSLDDTREHFKRKTSQDRAKYRSNLMIDSEVDVTDVM